MKFTRAFTLVAVMALAGCRAAAPPVILSSGPAPRMEVFLLVGQSNMAGRGAVEDEDRLPTPRVMMFDRNDQWVPAVDPVHFDKPTAGVGPGRAFGVAISRRDTDADIGLVPAAVGGTSIVWWEPGAQDPATKLHPYDDAIRRARLALKSGYLAGIIWHQGESDANAQAAPLYAERLRALVARFRADLGAPEVPFIVGQLGRFPERPWHQYLAQIDAVHRALPFQVSRAAYVSADGLTHRGDTLHFDSRSAREFGRRYASVFLALRDSVSAHK